LSGVARRVPPARLLAEPNDDTTTSMAWPGRANGGSSAVIMTAATFLARSSSGAIAMSRRLRALARVRRTIGELASSPVPARPTTRP
jgi:hypothetical protein